MGRYRVAFVLALGVCLCGMAAAGETGDGHAATPPIVDPFAQPAPANVAPAPSVGDAGNAYLAETSGKYEACSTSGGDRTTCLVDASPERCKQAVLNLMTAITAAASNIDFERQAWQVCVHSCGGASLWSKTVGDCRR